MAVAAHRATIGRSPSTWLLAYLRFMDKTPDLIPVTGATGYVGGRLAPRLLARDSGRLQGRPWIDQVEAVTGDAFRPETPLPAMVGVRAACYLIHSMQKVSEGNGEFYERDLCAARNFGQIAAAARVTAPVKFTVQDGLMIEKRLRVVDAPASAIFRAVTGVGGDRGWPSFNWARRARRVLDRMVGGVGFRRGRRDPVDLRAGDALDMWRVEAVEPDRLLRLRAEMRVPGRAWPQFEARPQLDGQTLLVQAAFFAPKGLRGLLYWYSLYPIHGPVFHSMIETLRREAETGK